MTRWCRWPMNACTYYTWYDWMTWLWDVFARAYSALGVVMALKAGWRLVLSSDYTGKWVMRSCYSRYWKHMVNPAVSHQAS